MEYRNQVEKLDCGISIIQAFHKYYFDEWLSLSTLKANTNYDNNGISLNEFSRLANHFGIKCDILQGDFESFKKIKTNNPFVTIIKNDEFLHYVIIEKFTSKGNVIFIDPILGKRKINFNDFEKMYYGIIIVCEKGEIASIKEKTKIELFTNDFLKEKLLFSFISIFVVVLSFIGSFYIKLVIDQIAPSNLKDKLLVLTILFILIMIIKTILSILNNLLISKIEIKYQFNLVEKYINKISKVNWLKINHYDESMHLKNLEMMMKVASFKSNYLFDWITQLFCLVFSTITLVVLDIHIFLISLIISAFTILISFLFRGKFNAHEKETIKQSIFFKKSYLNIINGVEQYKLLSTKTMLKNNFFESLNQVIKTQIDTSNTAYFYSFLQTCIKNIAPFIIVVMSLNKVWENQLSIGQVFLFLSIFNFFIEPLSSFTSMLIDMPIMKQYLENINSFLCLDDERKNDSNNIIKKINSIRLENINFKYKDDTSVLKIKELNIDGKMRIVGSNGSGKSTLLKIISTLIMNQEVYFNGNHIDYYNLESIRNKVCLVSNDVYLPSCTIYDYLVNQNKSNRDYLLKNIDTYKLLKVFEKMNLNLNTKIDDGGKNLSSGQKQFISIMKIFSNDYSVILFDESFENIDNEILKIIFPKLKKYLENKIVVEVSHRKNYLFNKKEVNCELFK